jgi:sec-independent protein translocase protein TatA
VIQVLGNLSGWHLIIIAGVVVLLFGAAKLPVFSKNLGQSIKIFKKEINDGQDDRRTESRSIEAEKTPVYTDEPPAASDEPHRATGAAAPRVPGSPQR